MDDEAIDALRRVYNDAYCEQRKAGVEGGNAERAAMRELLTHVITQAVAVDSARRALVPPEWLKPGAVVPVSVETVSLLLDAVRLFNGDRQ